MNYIILLEQLEPMNAYQTDSKDYIGVCNKREESQNLSNLLKALKANRQTQEKLKATRDLIRSRMLGIQGFISTFLLNQQYPPATAIVSYIKFQRHLSTIYRDQQRIAEQPLEIKAKHDQDAEFMMKLNQKKAEKKKHMLNIEDLTSDPKYINLVDICKGTQFKNGLEVYRAIIDSKKKKQPKELFKMQEDQKIENIHRMYGENWEKINQFLDNRKIDEVYYEYHNRINPQLATGRWTIRQTLMLIVLLQHFGAKKWATIAQKMVIKSQLQVRQRYCNLVDPSIGKDVWTYEMEKYLLEIAEQYEFCWKRISLLPIFKNKTDNCIWRKYKLLMVRFTEEQIHEMLPNQKKYRGLAEKIIKQKRIIEGRKCSAKNKPQPPIYYNKFRPKSTQIIAQISPPSQNISNQAPDKVEIASQSQMSIMMEMDEEYFHDYIM